MEAIEGLREGQFVRIYQKITDAKKERIVPFQGKIIKVKGAGLNKMITVQNALEGVVVDRIFPVSSPTLTKIELMVVKESKKATRKRNAKKRK
ncbi:MAG: 50S ribosomal protein L19 [Candidatus Levybacteria bacterium]|nr:50S ribosomal protein L19 [Candidatus Levybacteria bacterium]MBP9815411.1 50S ribosomal protein L19 [Candidatus Levybacteria bacterium]